MTDAEAGNSDSRINVMSVEDLSQTMAATVSAVSKMGEQVSKIANEIGDVKKAVEASANNSTTIKAMGLNDKDKKDGKKMEKDASATREMITKMSESIFAAAAESDPDKRMAAIQDALGGDTITRKVASLEAAIASQSHTIAVQNAELSRPRVEFLEKAYGESGAGEEQVATLKASWEKMPIDTLDEEISKVRLLQSNSLRPAAGGPPLLATYAPNTPNLSLIHI